MRLRYLTACVFASLLLLASAGCDYSSQFRGRFQSASIIDARPARPRDIVYQCCADQTLPDGRRMIALCVADNHSRLDILVLALRVSPAPSMRITGLPDAQGQAWLVDGTTITRPEEQWPTYFAQIATSTEAQRSQLPGVVRMTGTVSIAKNQTDLKTDIAGGVAVDLRGPSGMLVKGKFKDFADPSSDLMPKITAISLIIVGTPAVLLLSAWSDSQSAPNPKIGKLP